MAERKDARYRPEDDGIAIEKVGGSLGTVDMSREPIEIDLSSQAGESTIDIGETSNDLSTIDAIVYATNKLKQPLDAAPTYTPKNFYEQFAHYDDSLYVNINNSWQNVSGGKAIARAYRISSDQTISNNTATKIQFNAELFDVGSNFDESSTYGFTVPRDGYYRVSLQAAMQSTAAADKLTVSIYKNAASVSDHFINAEASGIQVVSVDDIVTASANDVIYGYAKQETGGNAVVYASAQYTYISINEL